MIEPIGYRIVVKPMKVKNKTKGGVFIPDEVVERNAIVVQVGKVIAIGPDAFNRKDLFPSGKPYDVGDWVVYAPHIGVGVTIDDDYFRVMNDDHILAKTEEPSEIKSTVL